MTTFHKYFALAALACLGFGFMPLQAADAPPKRLSGFGSSVCNGQGDELTNGGYIGRLGVRLAAKGWSVTNASRGGDNTIKIQERWEPGSPKRSNVTIKPEQYLMPTKPNYVWVGLSLNNEGLTKAKGEDADEVVAEKWVQGMHGIFERLRSNGITPAMGNCYANSAFTPEDYAATKAMNLQIAAWDVPSANFLGAVEDGSGKWSEGFFHDRSHPNSAGHTELMEAIVPSLFDALAAGKKPPMSAPSNGGVTFPAGSEGGLVCTPEYPWHAFSVTFRCRGEGDATLVSLDGRPQDRTIQVVYGKKSTNRVCQWVPAAADKTVTLSLTKAGLVFDGTAIASPWVGNEWNFISLTSRPAANFVQVSVNGVEKARIPLSLFIRKVSILPKTTTVFGLKEVSIHRSALNEGEVKWMMAGNLFRSSLEVHAPLTEADPKPGSTLLNDAQSLAALTLVGRFNPKK